MRWLRSGFVGSLLAVLCLFLTVPAENLPETAYDESEPLPYENTPAFLDVIPEAASSGRAGLQRLCRDRKCNFAVG
jgi:hypothetical protein